MGKAIPVASVPKVAGAIEGVLDGCEIAGALAGLDVGDDVCDVDGDSVVNSVIVLVPTTA